MPQPNILWVVSDHQAFANRGVAQEFFVLQSRLRAMGAAFPSAYTVLPICSPSRASMLTGLYPHCHGVTENDGRFGGRAEMGPDDRMVQHDLADAGYRCGWFGKWHLSQSLSALDFGFEGFSLPGYGYPYGTDAYCDYLARFHDGPLWAEVELPGESRRTPGDRVDLTAMQNWFDYEAGTAIIHGVEETHEAFFLADMAKKWIDALDEDKPFFVRLDTWGPHPPYTLPTGFQSPLSAQDVAVSGNLEHNLGSRPQHHRDYRDQWRQDLPDASFDWALLSLRAIEHCILVERALLCLVEHLDATGKLDNTIVVFCADHGDAVASNGGVMNKGSLMVEETLRIPLIIAGPGIAPGVESDSLIGNIDLAPTLLELCGQKPQAIVQGRSAARHLADPKNIPFRDKLMVEHYGLHTPILQRGLYAGDWKYVIQPDGFEELYNLKADPCESINLAWHTDHGARLGQFRKSLREEMQALNDTDPRLAQMRWVLGG